MKTATVTAGSRENPITVTAQIDSVDATAELTPDPARSFARTAFGHTSGVTVSDGHKTYRLSGDKCRLVAGYEHAGRPKLDASNPTERIAVTLQSSLVAKLDRIAPNGNRSAWIRQEIEAAKEEAMEHDYGYPFGYAEAGLEEVTAGCPACQDAGVTLEGHFVCNPTEREIVVGPILTIGGWKALVKPE